MGSPLPAFAVRQKRLNDVGPAEAGPRVNTRSLV